MDTLLRGADSAELPADREGQLRGPTDLSCPAAAPQIHDNVRVWPWPASFSASCPYSY